MLASLPTSERSPLDLPHHYAAPRAIKARWDRPMLDVFDLLNPTAVVLAGFVEPVVGERHRISQPAPPSNIAGRPVWPVRFGLSRSRKDTVSPRLDQSPFEDEAVVVLLRLWTPSEKHARDLIKNAVPRLEDPDSPHYLRDYFDLGPDGDLARAELTLLHIAHDLGMRIWDEAGLAAFCVETAHLARHGHLTKTLVDQQLFRRMQ